jgi:hypothetical protein
MKKSKEYNIDSFDKLANAANDDNYENLAIDLAQMFIVYYEQIKIVRKVRPKETDGLINTDIFTFGFRFVDDSKNDVLGIDLTNKSNGEITKIR